MKQEKQERRERGPVAVIYAVLTALVVLTGAVAVPLLCRPFYYAHIGAMGLPEYTGLTAEEIKAAFDQVMDFCLGLRPDFAAGVLPFSASGASHFADVKVLFLLDLRVLEVSALLLLIIFIICRRAGLRPRRLLGRGPGFWAAAGLGIVFLAVGGLAALDFDRAFVVFHSIFFPGKTNWIFDWQTDPVILILPEDFFRNCAILIFALIIFWCAVLIAADLIAGRRGRGEAPSKGPKCG